MLSHRRNRSVIIALLALLLLLLAACGGGDTAEEPAADPAPVEEAAEEVAEETVVEEPTAEPEPTEEPTPEPEPTEEPSPTPEPEPTEEPTPAAPTVSLAAGDYIYSNGNVVRDVARYEGGIWAAGTGGLVRFDIASGEAKKYTTLDGLPNIGVFSLEVCPVDGTERLLIGHRDGLMMYDAANDSWEMSQLFAFADDQAIHEMRCDAANGRLLLEYDDVSILDLATGTRTDYTEDDDGLAWFAVEQVISIGDDVWAPTGFKGISRIGIDGTVETLNMEGSGFPDDDVTDIVQLESGTYWLAVSDGLVKWENGSFTLLDRDTHPDVIDFFGPDHMELAADGTIWLGFTSELCQFDPATESCLQKWDLQDDIGMDDNGRLARLEMLDDGAMLLHTFDHGSAYFDGAAWNVYALADQAPHNFYDALYQTSDGTIWSTGSGVYVTDLEATGWTQFDAMSFSDMVELEDGTLWLAGGWRVGRFDGNQLITFEEEQGLPSLSHNNIAVTDGGVVYAGGSGGYSVIDGDVITPVSEGDGWDGGNIRDLLAVGDTVYAATVNGLFTLNGAEWTQLLDETYVNLPDDNIGALAMLSDGTLLLGTTRGMAMFMDGEVTAVSEITGSVQDIFVTADDQIHAVTIGFGETGGYFHYDGSTWSVRPDSDFPMSSLRAVLVDTAGTVWVGTGDTGLGGGIFRIVP